MVEKNVKLLMDKGVHIPCPESVEIGEEVSADRVSGNGVTLHGGCKIFGAKTLIMDQVQLGYEAPVTINNCQLGKGVKLKGGFFHESTFLDKSSIGSGAQIRESCLIEEHAKGAHTVGLKHTILFPFVTLGSLINFCDCLMAGGTDDKNHSEVGSSYIHFNYTPNQDKATPSLIGDVPRGVMLNQSPIFLGGQGGLVGPVRVEYGTVVAAGNILRKDILKGSSILLGTSVPAKRMPFHKGLYTNTKRIIHQNTIYISNLIALRRWYRDVRPIFVKENPMGGFLLAGAKEKLDRAIEERLKRLGSVARKMPNSIEIYKKITEKRFSEKSVRIKQEFFKWWEDIEEAFREGMEMEGEPSRRERFIKAVEDALGKNGEGYIDTIQGLDEKVTREGSSWLQGLTEEINDKVWALLPNLGLRKVVH